MPAIDFQGIDAGVVWTDFSPRLGATYDLKGDGKTVLSTLYATYYGQMAPGDLSSQLAATGAVFVRYPWADSNGDKFVQPNEVNTSVPFLSKSNAYDPANPTNAAGAGGDRSGHQERSHARVHRRLRSPGGLGRWRSAPAISGASTTSSIGRIA